MRRNDAIRALQGQTEAIRALGATSLYLFGSTARDRAGSKSDLDLFIDYAP
jgi:predicted nucleotidyltransferase